MLYIDGNEIMPALLEQISTFDNDTDKHLNKTYIVLPTLDMKLLKLLSGQGKHLYWDHCKTQATGHQQR